MYIDLWKGIIVLKRASGIQMNLNTIPGNSLLGKLGQYAFAFVERMVTAGQKYWYVGSVSCPICSFAGNVDFINVDALAAMELVKEEELTALLAGNITRDALLRLAFSRINSAIKEQLEEFKKENHSWLPGFCHFMALTGGTRLELIQKEEDYQAFLQFLFATQWAQLKSFCEEKGISIIGDMTISVRADSFEASVFPDLFVPGTSICHEEKRCYPDFETKQQGGLRWYRETAVIAKKRYHMACIMDFAFYDIVAEKKIPGNMLIQELQEIFPKGSCMINMDGIDKPVLKKLATDSGFLQLRNILCALESKDPEHAGLPHNQMSGMITCCGIQGQKSNQNWVYGAEPSSVAFAVDYLNLSEREGYSWGLIRGTMQSPAFLALIRAQDIVFDKISSPTALTDYDWTRLAYYTQLFGRCQIPGKKSRKK